MACTRPAEFVAAAAVVALPPLAADVDNKLLPYDELIIIAGVFGVSLADPTIDRGLERYNGVMGSGVMILCECAAGGVKTGDSDEFPKKLSARSRVKGSCVRSALFE